MDDGPLRRQADDWVREGLVTRAQADAIVEREQARTAFTSGPPAKGLRGGLAGRRTMAFILAAVLPLFGFAMALALADLFDEVTDDPTRANDLVVAVFLVGGVAGAVWGYLRRSAFPGQLALVAAASLLCTVGFFHPEVQLWMALPAPVLLAAGLAVAQPPEARVANAALLPLAMVPVFDVFPTDAESLALAGLVVLHWLATCLLLAPSSRSRILVVGALAAAAAAVSVMTLYFLATDPTWQRGVLFLLTAGLAVLFLGFARHPRLRTLTLRPLAG